MEARGWREGSKNDKEGQRCGVNGAPWTLREHFHPFWLRKMREKRSRSSRREIQMCKLDYFASFIGKRQQYERAKGEQELRCKGPRG